MELEKSMSVISTVYVNIGQWSEWPPVIRHISYRLWSIWSDPVISVTCHLSLKMLLIDIVRLCNIM